MPATTKKQIKKSTKPIIVIPGNVKTIPKVPSTQISNSKSFQAKLNDIQNNIDIDIDDIPDDLLEVWNELEDNITPKLVSKNYKLWLTIFTPFILPGIINGMSGKPSVPQPVVTVQEPAPEPKQIVNFAQKYFAEHGLELCHSLTKTDLSNIKQDLINNWGKGPDVFSKAFQDSYPVSKSRLENIYRSERHIAEYNGVLERAKIADHKYKQWRTVGDERSCDLCMSYDMETVPINEPFSNGEMTAMGHPNCRCSMVTYSDEDYDDMPNEEISQDSSYLNDVFDTIKQNSSINMLQLSSSFYPDLSWVLQEEPTITMNYKCPKGTIDDSNKCGLENKSGSNEINYKNDVSNIDQIRSSLFNEKPIAHENTNSDKKFIESYKKKWDNFNKLEDSVILEWQTPTSYDIKKYLNEPKEIQETYPKLYLLGTGSFAYNEIIAVMDKILEATKTPDDIVAYRNFDPKQLIDVKPGDVITSKCYTSVGMNKEIALLYNAHYTKKVPVDKREYGILQIDVPKGTNAMYIPSGKLLSHSELVLHRNLPIKINKIEKINNITYISASVYNKSSINDQKQNSLYLEEVANFIKLNYKCKTGTVDNSNKCGIEQDKSINSGKTIDELDDKHLNAISDYTKGLSNQITSLIMNHEINDYEDPIDADPDATPEQNIQNLIDTLDDAIVQSVPLETGIYYHGTDDISKYIEGDEFEYSTFMSITDDLETARQFGDVSGSVFDEDYNATILKVIVPNDIKGITIPPEYSGSDFADMKESILARNTKFVIGKTFVDNNTKITEVTAIPDKQKQDSAYLADAFETIKLNYNCPDSEKNGSGPGSCGGNTPGKKSFDVSKPIDHDSYELIKNSQTEDSKNLTKEEVRAIKSEYTLVSAYINSALANGKIYQELSEGMKEKTKHNAELVVSGINKFKIPENVVVWRGVKSDIENSMSEEQKQPGTIFDNNTIISTSFKSPEKALGYSKHTYTTGKPLLLEISLPKGSPALLTDTLVDKRGTYEHSSESEIIVAPGKIKVLDYEETDTIRKLRWEYIPETQKQNSSYLSDAFETIKLNYKCKAGTVDDSNKCDPEQDRSIELDKPAIDLSTLPEGSKLVESKDINNIKMVHFTKPENVAPIQETGFNYSRNSTHGKGVYFTNDDNLKAYGTGKIEIELLPHNQLFVNRDIHVPKVLEQISGVRYDSPELPGKMIEKGFGSVRFKMDDETQVIVFDKSKIIMKQKHDSAYLADVFETIKLNYKCPKGTVDDTNACGLEGQPNKSSETFIGFKSDHDFSSPQDIEANKQIQASLNKAAEPLKKFKPEDRRILRQYSVNSYVDVNQYLNGTLGKEVDQDSSILRHAKEDVVALDKLFSEANLQEPLVTYRGLKDDIIVKNPELRDALDTPGSEIEFPCFSSTSALPFMANNFAEGYNGRLLELQLPTGTKALFIAEESGLPNEFEILVNRGTKFKVVETRYTNIIPPNNGSYKDRSAKHVKITTIKAIV